MRPRVADYKVEKTRPLAKRNEWNGETLHRGYFSLGVSGHVQKEGHESPHNCDFVSQPRIKVA